MDFVSGLIGETGLAGAGGLATSMAGTGWDGGFCGKSGVVLALEGAPVSGGAEGFGGVAWGVTGAVCFVMLGIGLVTAVDQAGGADVTGAGSS